MRARATVFLILGVTAMVALPALGHAQSPAVTRGVLRGTLSSPDTTTGVVRGAVPPGATGIMRGSLPPGGTAGLLQRTPAGAKVGVLQDTAWAATVPVLPARFRPRRISFSAVRSFPARSPGSWRSRFPRTRVSESRLRGTSPRPRTSRLG